MERVRPGEFSHLKQEQQQQQQQQRQRQQPATTTAATRDAGRGRGGEGVFLCGGGWRLGVAHVDVISARDWRGSVGEGIGFAGCRSPASVRTESFKFVGR